MFQDQRQKNTSTHSTSDIDRRSAPQALHSAIDTKSSQNIELPTTLSSTYEYIEATSQACYKNLVAWLDSSAKVAHENLSPLMQPIREQVNAYLKTVDIEKTQSAFKEYSDVALKEIHDAALYAKAQIDGVLQSEDAIRYRNTLMSYLRPGLEYGYECCAYCASKVHAVVSPYMTYLGNAILGEHNFKWLSDTLYSAASSIGLYVQSIMKAILGDAEKDAYLVKNDFNPDRLSHLDTYSSLDDMRDASDQLDSLLQVTSEYFGQKKEDFLAHRITDTEEDGIREKQPDVVRQELLGELVRKPSDPFPSYEDRQRDERELVQRTRYENLQLVKNGNTYVRTGIDGELSATDKLEVMLKGKPTV